VQDRGVVIGEGPGIGKAKERRRPSRGRRRDGRTRSQLFNSPAKYSHGAHRSKSTDRVLPPKSDDGTRSPALRSIRHPIMRERPRRPTGSCDDPQRCHEVMCRPDRTPRPTSTVLATWSRFDGNKQGPKPNHPPPPADPAPADSTRRPTEAAGSDRRDVRPPMPGQRRRLPRLKRRSTSDGGPHYQADRTAIQAAAETEDSSVVETAADQSSRPWCPVPEWYVIERMHRHCPDCCSCPTHRWRRRVGNKRSPSRLTRSAPYSRMRAILAGEETLGRKIVARTVGFRTQ